MIRAGIYARISSDRDGDQLAITRQVADCEALVGRRGWHVAERYVDADVSAYSGAHRPEYRRMLQEIRAGLLDAVVVWHLDRLHRQPKELEEFFEVCDSSGVRNLASVTGDVDLSTDDGRFMARILGAVSRKESDDKSRRIRRKALELAQAGRIAGGGTRPYGYDVDRKKIRDDEAAVIRELAERFISGDSLRALCTDLNQRHVSTVTGKTWTTQVLRRMLRSGRISGQREHHGELIGPAEWPAIIAPAQTALIRTRLDDPTRRTNRAARRYLLSRLIVCGKCGERLVSRPRNDGQPRYICAKGPNFSGCGGVAILAQPLEQFVVEAVLYRLDSPELAAALAQQPVDHDGTRLQEELQREHAHLDELARAYGDKAIGLSEWLAARAPIERRLSDAKKQLAALNRTTAIATHVGNASELREAFDTFPLTRQRAIVAGVLDHIVVRPARRGYNRFDPGRLHPIWSH